MMSWWVVAGFQAVASLLLLLSLSHLFLILSLLCLVVGSATARCKVSLLAIVFLDNQMEEVVVMERAGDGLLRPSIRHVRP